MGIAGDDSSEWLKPPWWFSLGLSAARLARKTGWGRKSVQRARNWLLQGVLYELHIKAAHPWRRLAVALADLPSAANHLTPITEPVCNGCRDAVAELLDVPPARLHCTLKMLLRKQQGDSPVVATIGRSDNLVDRPPEWETFHEVRRNTVFAALCGEDDGHRHWRPLSYFSCNDLTKHIARFSCDREKWSQYYQSTVAAPLRYETQYSRQKEVIGFLTFDMPTKGQFTAVPDSFAANFHKFHEQAAWPAVIHCTGIMADTLAVILRDVLER